MQADDQSSGQDPKMGSSAGGFTGWLRRAYQRHQYRYGAANKREYRMLVQMFAAGAVLFAAAGILWVGEPHYQQFKERRAARLAAAYWAAGDLPNAALRARESLMLNPNDVTAIKVMADIAARSQSPDEFEWRKKAAALQPTTENKLLLVETGFHAHPPPFDLLAQTLAELAPVASQNARYHNLAAQMALARRELPDADAHFAQAAQLEPTNAHYALNLALFRIVMTNETQKADARARLRQLQSDPVYGPAALRGLIQDRLAEHDALAAKGYSEHLLASPQASLKDQLQNLDVRRQLHDDTAAARLAELQRQARTNSAAVAEISSWMLADGMAAEDLKWLATLPESELNLPPLLLAQANAYESAGDWKGLSEFASQQKWGDLEYLRLAMLTHAHSQLGEDYAAHSNWYLAENEAGGRLDRLERLGELAARWRLQSEETELLERLLDNFPEDRAAAQALAQAYTTAGQTAALHGLYARLVRNFPGELNYRLGFAATALLLETNLAEAKQWAAAAYHQTPGNPQVATAYAYALHLDNRNTEGIAVLSKLTAAELSQPSSALYYGVLLAAAGDSKRAAPWLETAQKNANALLPEEKRLLSATHSW